MAINIRNSDDEELGRTLETADAKKDVEFSAEAYSSRNRGVLPAFLSPADPSVHIFARDTEDDKHVYFVFANKDSSGTTRFFRGVAEADVTVNKKNNGHRVYTRTETINHVKRTMGVDLAGSKERLRIAYDCNNMREDSKPPFFLFPNDFLERLQRASMPRNHKSENKRGTSPKKRTASAAPRKRKAESEHSDTNPKKKTKKQSQVAPADGITDGDELSHMLMDGSDGAFDDLGVMEDSLAEGEDAENEKDEEEEEEEDEGEDEIMEEGEIGLDEQLKDFPFIDSIQSAIKEEFAFERLRELLDFGFDDTKDVNYMELAWNTIMAMPVNALMQFAAKPGPMTEEMKELMESRCPVGRPPVKTSLQWFLTSALSRLSVAMRRSVEAKRASWSQTLVSHIMDQMEGYMNQCEAYSADVKVELLKARDRFVEANRKLRAEMEELARERDELKAKVEEQARVLEKANTCSGDAEAELGNTRASMTEMYMLLKNLCGEIFKNSIPFKAVTPETVMGEFRACFSMLHELLRRQYQNKRRKLEQRRQARPM